MRTSLREFLPMTISTPSVNSCDGINRACAVCCGNSRAQTSRWQTTSHRKLFSGPTKTSAAFAVKRGFPHGFIGSRTIAFARTRGVARNWLAWTVDPGLRHDLMHALNLLPLHERTAVVLCCQNGLSHDEAARVLDIPLGTVKTNVLRGREKLKRTLAAWGPN
jgi:hypothetical protein